MGPGVGLGSSCLLVSCSLRSLSWSQPLLLLVLSFRRRRSCCGDALSWVLFFLPRCCVFCVSCYGGCAWGVLVVSSHLLKRVCPSPSGASQHAPVYPPLCLRSVLLLLACLSFGIRWYEVMLCTRILPFL